MNRKNKSSTNAGAILQYCSGVAKEFEARLNRIANFVTKHNLSVGTANETILRNFLIQLSSGRYKVGQGFIYALATTPKVSKQCDIILYDHLSYPLIYSESGIDVIFPQSAKCVIEVKTKLKSDTLKTALENIASARKLNHAINGVIFAFQSYSENTILRNLKRQVKELGLDVDTSPISILILDKGLIIHRWPGTELGGTSKAFSIRQSKNHDNNMVIAFLLLHFYDVQMQGVWGGASIENLLQELLKQQTIKYADDIPIG
ncbi:MAG: DUF6602 domain-containing protein [Chloroflexota bacterium]